MWRRIAAGVFWVIALTQELPAAERWICLRSPNFELYTTSSEGIGRDALQFFEQVRRAFTEILGVKLPENKPITVIAFRDEQTFAPYRPQGNVGAYSMFLPNRDFIVMQDLNPEHYQIGLHEFTHVVIRQAGMNLPLWLDEGFAEFFATLKPAGNKILVGRIIPGRLQDAQSGLVNLREVLATDRRSPLYHEANRVGGFYAESWALVHMLKFSDRYSPHFEQFLDAVGRGQSSIGALQEVYGKTIEQIQADLQQYVHGNRFREGVIKARLAKPGPAPQLLPLDPVDMEVLLAGIEARGPHRQNVIAKLEELARANPGKLSPVEFLAWIHLNGSDRLLAIASFRRALQSGTRDANLCYEFAMKFREWIPDADYVAALQRATEIDPGFSAAQQQLAAHAFNAHDYSEAVTRLHLVKKLERSNAFMYYRALSFAAFQIGNVAEAKSAAARAEQYAVAPEDKRLADEMLKYVSGGNPSNKAPAFGRNPLPPQ